MPQLSDGDLRRMAIASPQMAQADSTAAKAAVLWENMSASEKRLVRFGIFPAGKMHEAEREGHDSHALVLALMAVADKNGGMIL